jgi:amino acid permease
MTAGEAENPRFTLKRAFKSVVARLAVFFILGSLCVGIVVAYNDPLLVKAIKEAHPGGASSPYVISMLILDIPVLPHIVNVSAFCHLSICVILLTILSDFDHDLYLFCWKQLRLLCFAHHVWLGFRAQASESFYALHEYAAQAYAQFIV